MPFVTPWVWLALVGASAPLSGAVVNPDGKSVDGAIVWPVANKLSGPGVGELAPTRTAGDGAFTISLAQRAVQVDGEGVPDGPITRRPGARQAGVPLRGRVRGPEGRPVSGARVEILLRTGGQHGPSSQYQGKPIVTAADGAFATPDDVPVAALYRLAVRADGMEPTRGEWSPAPGGRLPDLVMRPVTRLGAVIGRVVDLNGEPVAGAEVVQSGDGPRRTSDITGADGRFRVPDVFDAVGFVFVRKKGYRVVGRRVGVGEKPIELVIERIDGPPPAPLKRLPPPLTRTEERAKARELAAPLWEPFCARQVATRGPSELGPALALVDTDRMVELIENQVVRPDERLLAGVALGLFATSPRDAVATLNAIQPPERAAAAILDLFDSAADAPPARRRDLLERASTRIRRADDRAQRCALLARLADRWYELGEPAKGRPLLEEARAELPRVGGARSASHAAVAEALSRVDLDAALALLDGQSHAEILARIARRTAAEDADGAARVFRRIQPRPVKLSVLADVCATIATRDLPKALALAGPRSPGVAALSVAAAARSKAKTDPAAARALLAEAFDRLEQMPDTQIVVPAVAMARLLPIAVEIDPGRSSEYLWRAIAARPARVSDDDDPRPRDFRTLAALAALVAAYDRESADIVFAPVATYGPALVDERFDLDETQALLQAAVLFDARAAMPLLEAVPVQRCEPARIAFARLLALPRSARRREALRVPNQADLWPVLLDDRWAPPSEGGIKP